MPLPAGQTTRWEEGAGVSPAPTAARLLNTWRAAEDPTRFTALRIVFGLVLLADMTHLYAHLNVFPIVRAWPVPLRPLLALWLLIIMSVIVGYRLRAAMIANYVCCMVILGVLAPQGGFSGADPIAIGLSLLIVVLPCNAATIDRVGGREGLWPAITAARWLLAAYLSSIYVDSGISKVLSPMWSSGFGAATPMGLPSMVWMDTSWMARIPALVLRLVGWGVVGFELLFPALYAWRVTRVSALAAGIALHVGIACLYPIPAFSGEMLAIYAGLLPDECYAPLRRLDRLLAKETSARASMGPQWPWSRLTLRGMLATVSLWAGCIALTYAPQYVTYRPLWFMLKAARRVAFVATGILNRAVFQDGDFSRYHHQLRLVGTDSIGSERVFPYSRNGLFTWAVHDRVWNQWWKNTQGVFVPMRQAELLLGIWAESYWPVSAPVTVRIEGRHQDVAMDRIDGALFSRNSAVAWGQIGEIWLSPGAPPRVAWFSTPRSREEHLGDYLSRVLPARSP
jgi:hypothetical protein